MYFIYKAVFSFGIVFTYVFLGNIHSFHRGKLNALTTRHFLATSFANRAQSVLLATRLTKAKSKQTYINYTCKPVLSFALKRSNVIGNYLAKIVYALLVSRHLVTYKKNIFAFNVE